MSEIHDYKSTVIDLGDDASRMLYEACKYTWPNREGKYGEIMASVDHFRGSRSWSDAPLLEMPRPEGFINSLETDGIGTKILVSQRTSRYDTAAFDLVAMAADDAAAKGFEPAVFGTSLAVNRLNERLKPYMQALAEGAVQAAKIAGIALFGGETAILGDMIRGYGSPEENLHYDWTATIHAKAHKERLIDGSRIRPGMALVGLREPGFRSNGITTVRKTLEKYAGEDWHNMRTKEGKLGDAVLRGSVIYTPVLVEATGGMDLRVMPGAEIVGAAHLTGGGLSGKLMDLLNVAGYGAEIDDPFPMPEVMKLVQKEAGMTDEEAYGSFHGGQGMIVVTEEPDRLVRVAEFNNVEAREFGIVTHQPSLTVRSAGYSTPGKMLKFPVAA